VRVAVYVRVSTARQTQQQTIEQQLVRLHAHVQQQGWPLSQEHVYRDDGCSGATLARPGLDRLRDQVARRELDRVMITAPDRLARNYVQQMVLLEEFAQHGCCVEFLDRPMSDDPHDQLLLQIRGAVAEYERTLIAERMRRGRLARLQAGLLLPWTRPPYGYRLHPDRPRDPSGVTVDAAEAAIVAELFALYLEPTMSLAALAKLLSRRSVPTPSGKHRWSAPTIRGILRNPTYTGQVYAQRTRYRPPQLRRSATHALGRAHGTATPQPPECWIAVGMVPALVTPTQFDQVQAKLAQNQSFARRNNTAHQYLLRALVSCGHCQLACTARTVNRANQYYLCNGKNQPIHSHRDMPCPARYIPAEQLDTLVWQDLCDVLTHPTHLTAALARAQGGTWLPQELQARRENLRAGRRSLQQQLDRLTEAYLRAVIPLEEYERRRRELEQKDQALATQERHLDGETERHRELVGLVTSLEAFCQRVQQGLADATFEQKRQLLLLLVDRVVVTDSEVEIRYVLPTTPASEHVRFCHLRKDYFDHPAIAAQPLAALDPAPRNAGHDVAVPTILPTVRGIIALVRVQLVGPPAGASQGPLDRRDGVQHRRQRARVGAVGRAQAERERDPLPVDQQMLLAARLAAIRRIRAGNFAPLFAGTSRLSRQARDQSIWSAMPSWSSRTRCNCSQTPASVQSRRRRQQVTPQPQPISRGSSSHGMPLCSTNRIPVRAARSGTRGRPPLGLGGSGGSSGAITSHSSSLTSRLLMPGLHQAPGHTLGF
jgi:site-specific DNA recombinase